MCGDDDQKTGETENETEKNERDDLDGAVDDGGDN